MRTWAVSLGLLLALALPALAGEKIIRLKNGRKVQGEVVEETTKTLVVKTGGGKVIVQRADVVEIIDADQKPGLERGKLPAKEAPTGVPSGAQGVDRPVLPPRTGEVQGPERPAPPARSTEVQRSAPAPLPTPSASVAPTRTLVAPPSAPAATTGAPRTPLAPLVDFLRSELFLALIIIASPLALPVVFRSVAETRVRAGPFVHIPRSCVGCAGSDPRSTLLVSCSSTDLASVVPLPFTMGFRVGVRRTESAWEFPICPRCLAREQARTTTNVLVALSVAVGGALSLGASVRLLPQESVLQRVVWVLPVALGVATWLLRRPRRVVAVRHPLFAGGFVFTFGSEIYARDFARMNALRGAG